MRLLVSRDPCAEELVFRALVMSGKEWSVCSRSKFEAVVDHDHTKL